jgi:hypothetical protein
MWPFKKKSADHALRELVDGLSQALGDKLLSVLVYGSKASGEYHEGRSDVNVFVLLENASWETLGLLTKPIRAWTQAGHAVPVWIQKSELQTYADSLPIEFLDMQDHHTVVFGSDPLQGLNVDRSHLRAQCAQELSVKELKLRQAVLLAQSDPKRLREALWASLPGVLTLYRAVLRLEADVPKGSKMMAAKELSKRAGFDGDCLDRMSNGHMRRETDNVVDLARHYVEGVERARAYAGRKK